MKKIALLLSAVGIGFASQAQLSLTGTSYTQNFDNIGSGLPQGWELDSNATATNKGTAIAFDVNPTPWASTGSRGRNVASKGSLTATESAANQAASTNRAFGLRMVGALDSQVAFVLQIANTSGLTNFNLNFKLMSLDSATAPRIATWRVDYGFGANPTSFTNASATGTLTTGGSTFSSNTINVNFGAALNNQAGPVWIRIVALNRTSGSGNRPTTAIDDFNLTWTGTGAPNYRAVITPVTPMDNATGVAALTTATLKMAFDRKMTKGTSGNITIKNQNAQTIQTKAVTSTDVSLNATGDTATIANVTLVAGTAYHVLVDSVAFDTAGFKSFGIVDSTVWNFSTAAPPVGTVTSLSETFNTSCPTGLPAGWQQVNVNGSATWVCNNSGPNYNLTINGGGTTSSQANEDWLITPQLAATAGMRLYFKTRYNFAGPNMEVLYSTNYSGTGSPAAAAWASLVNPYTAADSNRWVTKSAPLVAGNIYIAFKYTSNANTTVSEGRRWDVDSVFTTIAQGISTVNSRNNTIGVQVLGTATSGSIDVAFDLGSSAALQASIYDMSGREVYRNSFSGTKGSNKLNLQPEALQAGMYIIRISNGKEQGIARTFVR
jgi:hypothetical protein